LPLHEKEFLAGQVAVLHQETVAAHDQQLHVNPN